MDSAAHIGTWLVGGFLAIIVYWLLFGILVELPGHFIYSLFVERERDPDNLIEIDPTGRKSVAVGILFWAVLFAIGYGVYQLTK